MRRTEGPRHIADGNGQTNGDGEGNALANKSLSEILRLASVILASPSDPLNDGHTARAVAAAAKALRGAVERIRSEDLVFPRAEPRKGASLTPRERQVARLLVRGASYKEIAAQMGMTFSSAQSRVKAIYGKLGVHSKIELANSLARLGEG